ncbi:hypothetical protein FJZ28_04995, partial [Candidatus Peregrinibacteria bacterium]|nr:hypothetical protein [Candidatus Peregrinibacteria bacterium]
MASLIRRSALIVSAMLCSAALLSVIILSTIALTAYGSTPAEFLPADKTIALLHGANDALVPLWLKQFPAPGTGSMDGKTIAMLQSPAGNDIVVFERKTRGRTFAHSIGSYGLYLSRPDLLPTIVKKNKSLATLPAYRVLTRSFTPKTSWVFLKNDAIPKASSMRDHILSASLMGRNAEAVGFTAGDGIRELSIYAPAREAAGTPADARIPFAEHPFFVLSAGNLQASFRNTLSALPEHTAAILEGLVAQKTLDLFGPDVS